MQTDHIWLLALKLCSRTSSGGGAHQHRAARRSAAEPWASSGAGLSKYSARATARWFRLARVACANKSQHAQLSPGLDCTNPTSILARLCSGRLVVLTYTF